MSTDSGKNISRWFGPLELLFLFGTFIAAYIFSSDAILSGLIATGVWGIVIISTHIFARSKKSAKIEWKRILDILHIWP